MIKGYTSMANKQFINPIREAIYKNDIVRCFEILSSIDYIFSFEYKYTSFSLMLEASFYKVGGRFYVGDGNAKRLTNTPKFREDVMKLYEFMFDNYWSFL